MTGQNIGDVLNASGLSWGWFQGGFRPTTSFQDAAAATGHAGQSTATFVPDEFKGQFFQSAPHASDQGICNAVTPIGAGSLHRCPPAPGSRATRPTTSRTTSPSSTTPRRRTRTT